MKIAHSLPAVLSEAAKSGIGLVHVTNMEDSIQNAYGPSYFDYLFLNLKQNEKTQLELFVGSGKYKP